MPSIGHIAVGAAAGRLTGGVSRRLPLTASMILLSVISLLPDADGLAFTLGIPYGATLGHRGAFHSLAAALAIGALSGLVGRAVRLPFWRIFLMASAVAASHDLLDALTDGGRGVALLWPFSNRRFFAPWRPIPVAPIGLGMLSRRGLEVILAELLLFFPLFAYAFCPRPKGRSRKEGDPVEAGSSF